MKPVNATNNAVGAEKLAMDPQQLEKLKQIGANKNNPEAVKNASKQFEALFLGMVLKTMREASQSTGDEEVTGSSQQKNLTEFLDQQMAQRIASKGKGVGLANEINRQVEKMNGAVTPPQGKNGDDPISSLAGTMALIQSQPKINKNVTMQNAYAALATLNHNPNMSNKEFTKNASDFVNKMWGHASAAANNLGVPAHFLVAQAALETGWGKRQLIGSDGRNSHNLFGIKADSKWKGDYVEAMTTEWFGGVKQKMVQKFRSYNSYEDSFKDYANFLRSNPRYRGLFNNGVLDEQAFASTLQRSGYATDPSYANKLVRIMQSSTMRGALSGNPVQPTSNVQQPAMMNVQQVAKPATPKVQQTPSIPSVNNVNIPTHSQPVSKKQNLTDQQVLLNSKSIIDTLNSVYKTQ